MSHKTEDIIKLVDKHKYFIVGLVLVIITSFLRYQKGVAQQDNYVLYAKSFANNFVNLPHYESRLMPGFPFLIHLASSITKNYIFSAYFLTITLFILNYSLLYKITNSELSVIPLIFPPAMFNIATMIATESLTLFLIILIYTLANSRKYETASFISGVGFAVRPIISVTYPALFLTLYLKNRKILTFRSVLLFFIPVVFLAIFNNENFGDFSPFYQVMTYKNLAPHGTGIALFQIIPDLIRSIEWRQYSIFLSGLFYLGFFAVMLVNIYNKIRIRKDLISIFSFTSTIMMSVYVLSYSFTPFIENFGRYIIPMVPLFWILLHKKWESRTFFAIGLIISLVVILL